MNTVLEIKEVRKTYRGAGGAVHALDDVSLTLKGGDFVSVQGSSGCGKTTLLLAAGGLLQPSSGKVLLGGTDLYALSPSMRAAARAEQIGFVFQQFHLVPYLTVLENVVSPVLARRIEGAEQRALELLERFGLTHRTGHLPSDLSTGERQRTALARALLGEPKLLLADEPTGNLDPENGRVVLQYLADFAKGGGAVLLVTHDASAAQYTQRTLKLVGGRLQS